MPLNDVISVLYNPEKEKNRRHISKDIRQFTVLLRYCFSFMIIGKINMKATENASRIDSA